MKRFSIIIGICIVLGVFSAYLADTYLSERIPVWGSFAGLQYSLNPGIAFGIALPDLLETALIFAALCMITLLGLMQGRTPLTQWGYGLIVGGGLANAIDRVRDGYVTDYFQVGTFPIFNVPDSFVTIGVAILFIEALLSLKQTSHS